MIGGLVAHDGDPALAVHLSTVGKNVSIDFRTHGLSASTIADAIAEMRLMALGCRTSKPLLHAWASPSIAYSDAAWERHRDVFEREFDLQGHPCIEVFHKKFGEGGRTAAHVHRVYLRLDAAGKAVRTAHSGARQEKVSRVAEYLHGERFTPGCFNVAVIDWLRRDGLDEIASAMVQAGLADMRVESAPTGTERAMTERLADLSPAEVWRRAHDAWRRSDSGSGLRAALMELGLRLAMGEKCPVVVAPGGAIHPLLRAINKGGRSRIRKAELDDRIRRMSLPPAGEFAPLPGFAAGAFGITGLERQPVPHPSQQKNPARDAPGFDAGAALDDNHATQTPMRPLTGEQLQALADLSDAFHHRAARKARLAREKIEAEVRAEIQLKQALSDRIEAERSAWDLPTVGVPGWREHYKAELASLPAAYGARLRWVDRMDRDRLRLVLNSGATLMLAPNEARTDRATSDTVAVMISFAQEQGWSTVTVTGGTSTWREAMAREATAAGIRVVDEGLQSVVEDETRAMERRALIEKWLQRRKALYAHETARTEGGNMHGESEGAAEETPAAVLGAELLKELLQVLAEVNGRRIEISQAIADPALRDTLQNDMDAFERYRAHSADRRGGMHPSGP